ncbi:MAG TPA: hypothetical protein ENL37_06455 [Desulfobacteraceae bacterium]|nr:hypothetical protein [Desulfobacteraceae bacterium]
MLIYDDIFHWEGFGGRLRLASGKCLLKMFDRSRDDTGGVVLLKPVVVVATDLVDSKMTVRSCCSHIATIVTREHNIAPQRMQFVEHYPETVYGEKARKRIPQKFDAVELVWKKGVALHPKWRPVEGPLLDFLKEQFRSAKS